MSQNLDNKEMIEKNVLEQQIYMLLEVRAYIEERISRLEHQLRKGVK